MVTNFIVIYRTCLQYTVSAAVAMLWKFGAWGAPRSTEQARARHLEHTAGAGWVGVLFMFKFISKMSGILHSEDISRQGLYIYSFGHLSYYCGGGLFGISKLLAASVLCVKYACLQWSVKSNKPLKLWKYSIILLCCSTGTSQFTWEMHFLKRSQKTKTT